MWSLHSSLAAGGSYATQSWSMRVKKMPARPLFSPLLSCCLQALVVSQSLDSVGGIIFDSEFVSGHDFFFCTRLGFVTLQIFCKAILNHSVDERWSQWNWSWRAYPLVGGLSSWTPGPLHRLPDCPYDMAAGFPRLGPRVNEKASKEAVVPFMTYPLKSMLSLLLSLLDGKSY